MYYFLYKQKNCNCIWDSSRENCTTHILLKCYKNASRLHRYNFPTINAIDILFSPLHTTPFLYSKMHFGVLDYIRAVVPTCDTPWGSKLPYLRVGAVKSLQIRYVGREVLYLSICSVRYFLCHLLRRYS